MKKYIFILTAVVLGITACNDSEKVAPSSENSTIEEISSVPNSGESCNCEVEMACVKGDEAGTKCVNGVGKCRWLNGCRPVKAGIVGVPTFEEIEIYSHEHATWMVDNDFYLPEDYEITRQIGKQSLLDFYYP
jgi:hypothetical protein